MYDFQFCQLFTDSFTDYAFKTFLPGAKLYIYFPGCFSMFLSPLSPGSELYPEACPAPDALTALVRGGRVKRLGGGGARGGGLTRVLTKLIKL